MTWTRSSTANPILAWNCSGLKPPSASSAISRTDDASVRPTGQETTNWVSRGSRFVGFCKEDGLAGVLAGPEVIGPEGVGGIPPVWSPAIGVGGGPPVGGPPAGGPPAGAPPAGGLPVFPPPDGHITTHRTIAPTATTARPPPTRTMFGPP